MPDTINDSLVGSEAQGDNITIGRPRLILSREQALRLAAWIVAIAVAGKENR